MHYKKYYTQAEGSHISKSAAVTAVRFAVTHIVFIGFPQILRASLETSGAFKPSNTSETPAGFVTAICVQC